MSVLFCLMCQKFNSTGLNGSRKWVDIGCRSVRLDKVKEHEASSQHKNAVVASLTETLDEVTDKIDDASYNAVMDATKVLQFLLTKNLPLSLFGELTDLCIAVGSKSLSNLRLAKNATYTSDDIVKELLTLLHKEVKTEVTSAIKSSPCYATMVDEVCDLTIEKHMAMCSKYVDSAGDVKTSFVSDTTLSTATADVITNAIKTEVEEHNLDFTKMTGFASDGAAVFTGAKTGVTTRLKEQIPGLVTVHCKDHRLALACRDSFKEVPLFKKTDKLLEDLYRYYKNSSVHTASLKEVQKSFEDAPINIKQAKHHRWLSHSQSVNSIVRSYRSLVVDLESHTVSGDPVGNGILKQLKQPVNLNILLLLADVLPHLATLSLYLQGNDANLGTAAVRVAKTISIVEKRKTVDGNWLGKSSSMIAELGIQSTDEDTAKFQTARVSFLQAIVENINRRFADTDVMEALAVLDLSTMPEIPSFYGTTEMETLADQYNMDYDELLSQWQGFTEIVTSSVPAERTLPKVLKLFYGPEHQNKGLKASYPLVARLAAIAATVPVSTAEVERVFSQLKLIKTDHRCSLKAETLDKLLNVKLNCSTDMYKRLLPVIVTKFFGVKDRRLTKILAARKC